MAEKGKRYKVISDSSGFFNEGEIVIALENSSVPFCIRENDYDGNNNILHYNTSKYNPLKEDELEEIESEE